MNKAIPSLFFLIFNIQDQKWQEKYFLKGDQWYREVKVNDMPIFFEPVTIDPENAIAAYLWAEKENHQIVC